MACQVPVLVSDACGAAVDVMASHGTVLSLSQPMSEWTHASQVLLGNTQAWTGYMRSWSDVAAEYILEYQQINKIN